MTCYDYRLEDYFFAINKLRYWLISSKIHDYYMNNYYLSLRLIYINCYTQVLKGSYCIEMKKY